jgi:hypothetical protein
MQIKRISKIKINSMVFRIKWDKSRYDACFNYEDNLITIGTSDDSFNYQLALITHELLEIIMCELGIRYRSPMNGDDYLFNFNHGQFTVATNMLAGLLPHFIKEPKPQQIKDKT